MNQSITPELLQRAIEETREFGEARCIGTRCGAAARIYCSDAPAEQPVRGDLRFKDSWELDSWYANGSYALEGASEYDLVPTPMKRKVWLLCFPNEEVWSYCVEAEALSAKRQYSRSASAFKEIEVEDGEGL